VLRHNGRGHDAVQLATEACDRLHATGLPAPQLLSVYARSLCTAAYTVAGTGNRTLALDLVREATAAAQRTAGSAVAFGGPGVTSYAIGVHYALGDSAAALSAAGQVRPAELPSAERRARYWCDVARAWHQHGDPHRTYAALTAAHREAPAEVRDRGSMRELVTGLLAHDRRIAGLRAFAASVNALG
jgi:hypothetical protein